MTVAFKKVLRKNPQEKQDTGKYYPQLIVVGKPATLDSIAAKMKETSSLSTGDIQSVLTNFVTVMRQELFNGHSVSIANFGVFSLSAAAEGSEKRADCLSGKIQSLSINFRASTSIRPSVKATRAEDKIDFVDLDTLTGEADSSGDGSGDHDGEGGEPGGGESGGGGGIEGI